MSAALQPIIECHLMGPHLQVPLRSGVSKLSVTLIVIVISMVLSPESHKKKALQIVPRWHPASFAYCTMLGTAGNLWS